MSKVRIVVTSDDGDVEVEVSDQVSTYGGDERQRISRLLMQAMGMVDRAYGLSQKQAEAKPRMRLGGEQGA